MKWLVIPVVIVSLIGCRVMMPESAFDHRGSRASMAAAHDDGGTVETPWKRVMPYGVMLVFAVALLSVMSKGVLAPPSGTSPGSPANAP